jgi:hypothetical protein
VLTSGGRGNIRIQGLQKTFDFHCQQFDDISACGHYSKVQNIEKDGIFGGLMRLLREKIQLMNTSIPACLDATAQR